MDITKRKKKEKVGFSIDSEIIDLLDHHCDTHAINKSKLVNMLLRKYLDSQKNKDSNGQANNMDHKNGQRSS